MFDELWSEIMDSPGEIYDVIDYDDESDSVKEEKFDVDEYINNDYDY